jgi:hypothetical protein
MRQGRIWENGLFMIMSVSWMNGLTKQAIFRYKETECVFVSIKNGGNDPVGVKGLVRGIHVQS